VRKKGENCQVNVQNRQDYGVGLSAQVGCSNRAGSLSAVKDGHRS
jgi:hypothetical protein